MATAKAISQSPSARDTASRVVGFCALFPAAVAVVAMAGWLLRGPVLRSFAPGLVSMNPASAVAILLACAALWLQRDGRSSTTASALSMIVFAMGVWKLAAVMGNFDAGFDRLLFADRLRDDVGYDNRMAPNTAAAFVFLGAALVAIPRRVTDAQLLAIAAGCVGTFAFIGHLYGLADLYRVPAFIPMAFNTSIAITAASFGVLAARPHEGVAAVVTSPGPGGFLARRLLPAGIVVPTILGALRLWGEDAGFYTPRTGILLFLISAILLMSALVWWTARALDRMGSERARAEERILALNRELEAFSYSVSHDLRAPLRAIVGFSQAILHDHADNLDDEGRRLLGRVAAAGGRMSRLIDELLALSRLSRTEMRRSHVDLGHLAREVSADLRESEPGRDVELVVAEGLRVVGDYHLLRALLENLLGNAWKFTSKSERPRIEVGALPRDTGVPTFYVRDNGAGFDMRYADKLFTPFQRLHSPTEFDGTGIGLATVQRIVDRHRGRVWAKGTVGEGATFYFTLEAGAQ